MTALISSIGLILLAGVLALALGRYSRAAAITAATGIVTGAALGLIPVIATLVSLQSDSVRWSWTVPGGSLWLGIDPLSAVFLLIVFLLSIPVCLYGVPYLSHHHDYPRGFVWFASSVLIAAMAVVVTARNAVLFLVAWEAMSVSSYFLVSLDHTRRSVRRAGITYLVAAHIGVAFLIAFFLLLGRPATSLDFEDLRNATGGSALLFILALVGFGSKAGLVPFHVWLPEAHPVAPSHISALMSGVMIKMGIYGLLRAMLLLGPPSYWWGVTLIAVGMISAIVGILSALSQSNIKRLLAYSSVENVGIITIGLGIGALGWVTRSYGIAILGLSGAILHVVNHAIFKGALFLAAGSILQRTGTLELDRLGGLLRRMRRTGLVIVIGSVAIAGLPLGNGFLSEFLIYLGAFRGALVDRTDFAALAFAVVIGLALVGGLAIIGFAKLTGIGLLGQPRTPTAAQATESSPLMTYPMLAMGILCLVIGLNAHMIPGVLVPLSGSILNIPAAEVSAARAAIAPTMRTLSLGIGALAVVTMMAALARYAVLRGRTIRVAGTWDCGYAAPGPRMQYSGFSFVQMTVGLFRRLVPLQRRSMPPAGLFPRQGSFGIRLHDGLLHAFYIPLFGRADWALGRLRWLQHGNIHLYILYILVTTMVLLFWGLR
ncbi:MAG TPA: proton-conducting transporter membrane subunit [bacterium]|nr:proton-conducting transporter membrane subunit [bacterium]